MTPVRRDGPFPRIRLAPQASPIHIHRPLTTIRTEDVPVDGGLLITSHRHEEYVDIYGVISRSCETADMFGTCFNSREEKENTFPILDKNMIVEEMWLRPTESDDFAVAVSSVSRGCRAHLCPSVIVRPYSRILRCIVRCPP